MIYVVLLILSCSSTISAQSDTSSKREFVEPSRAVASSNTKLPNIVNGSNVDLTAKKTAVPPLYDAVRNLEISKDEFDKVLLEGDPLDGNGRLDTPLSASIQMVSDDQIYKTDKMLGKIKAEKRKIPHEHVYQYDPFYLAFAKGDYNLCKRLLEHYEGIRYKDKHGNIKTYLHLIYSINRDGTYNSLMKEAVAISYVEDILSFEIEEGYCRDTHGKHTAFLYNIRANKANLIVSKLDSLYFQYKEEANKNQTKLSEFFNSMEIKDSFLKEISDYMKLLDKFKSDINEPRIVFYVLLYKLKDKFNLLYDTKHLEKEVLIYSRTELEGNFPDIHKFWLEEDKYQEQYPLDNIYTAINSVSGSIELTKSGSIHKEFSGKGNSETVKSPLPDTPTEIEAREMSLHIMHGSADVKKVVSILNQLVNDFNVNKTPKAKHAAESFGANVIEGIKAMDLNNLSKAAKTFLMTILKNRHNSTKNEKYKTYERDLKKIKTN